MPSNYPAGIDSWANPTTTTQQNDPGFSHSGLHSQVQDAVEVIEAKLGIGASTATGAGVLRSNAAGASQWAQVIAADIANGAVETAKLAAAAAGQLVYAPFGSTSTTSAGFVGVTGSNLNITTTGKPVLFGTTLVAFGSSALALGGLQLWEQPSTVIGALLNDNLQAGFYTTKSPMLVAVPTAGAHSYYLAWNTSAGSLATNGGLIWALELK